jgi:hypothetical protein
MAKGLSKRDNFKKILAGTIALTAFLFSPKIAYASHSDQKENSQKEKAPISIVLGVRRGVGSSGLYSREFGIKYNRFALVGNAGSRPDINLQNIEEEMLRNVYFQAGENLENFSSVGASLEYYQRFGKRKGVSGVIGVGGNLEKRTRNIEEKLIRRTETEESLLASNTSSVPEKEFVWNIYAGPSFKLAKRLELNPVLGYEKAFKNGLKGRGAYVSIRAILSFSGGNK